MPKIKKKPVSLNVRIDENFRNRLRERAKKENRTVSNLVITVLLQYLDEKDKKDTKE